MFRNVDLIPLFLGEGWWEGRNRQNIIQNQKFATVLSDKDLSRNEISVREGFETCPRMPASVKASGASQVKIDEDEFLVTLDLDDFQPEELSVKTFDNNVEIHGRQEDKRDEHGLVSREFRRRYMVPRGYDIEALTASFSSNCKLTIRAPVCQEDPGCLLRKVKLVENPSLPMEVTLKDVREVVVMNYQRMIEATKETASENDTTKRDVKSETSGTMKECEKLAENMVSSIHEKFPVTNVSAEQPSESQGAEQPSESQGAEQPSESQE